MPNFKKENNERGGLVEDQNESKKLIIGFTTKERALEILDGWEFNQIFLQVNQDPNYGGGGGVQQEHISVKLGDNQTDRLIFHGNKLAGYENNSGRLQISGYWGNRVHSLREGLIPEQGEGLGAVEPADGVNEILTSLGIPKYYTGPYDAQLAQGIIKNPEADMGSKVEIFIFNDKRVACHKDEVSLIEALTEPINWDLVSNTNNYLLGIGGYAGGGFLHNHIDAEGNPPSLYTERPGMAPGRGYPILM